MRYSRAGKKAAIGLIATAALTAFFLSINLSPAPLPEGAVVDRILIEKNKRLLTLYAGLRPVNSYPISLGEAPRGNKLREGDRRTPEGIYYIEEKNTYSGYHLSLLISYPELEDLKRAEEQGNDPGGDIAIHGLKKGYGWMGRLHLLFDWTYGCVAVGNAEMDQIFHAVKEGTLVEILP